MGIDSFARQLEAARRRAAWQAQPTLEGPATPVDIDAILGELGSALNELRVIEEELQQQNEELTAARATIEAERQRYQDLFEMAPDAYLVTSNVGIIQAANRAAARLLAMESHQLVGRPLSLHVDSEERARLHDRLHQVGAGEALLEWETAVRACAGERHEVACAVTVVRDGRGAPIGLRWLLRDISARKRAEQALGELNADLERRVGERTAELKAALEAHEALLRTERAARAEAEEMQRRQTLLVRAGAILGRGLEREAMLVELARLIVSQHADACLIYTVEGDQALRLTAAVHREPAAEAQVHELTQRQTTAGVSDQALLALLESGTPLRWSEPAEGEGGGVGSAPEPPPLCRELGASACLVLPLIEREQVIGLLVLLMAGSGRLYSAADLATAGEVAQRLALALANADLYGEMQAALRARNVFLSSVSHDLRTPLTGIKALVQLLQRRLRGSTALDPEKIMQSLTSIDDTTTSMAALIQDLVDIARQHSGIDLDLERELVDLVALAGEAVAEHQASTTRHHLRLEGGGGDLVGLWDRRRLRRVLDNLLTNAIKYSPGGGEVVVAAARERVGAGELAVLAVRDHGIGIPTADLPNLFERFQRGSNVTGRISGTGVGLATVYTLVTQHGGSVAVESDEGQGSTFTLRLPLAPAPACPGQ